MEKLLPCPFCGEDDIKQAKHRTTENVENYDYYSICCRNPDCANVCMSGTDLEELKGKWNTRDGYS